MDTFEGFIRRIIKSFNSVGIDYMFTGALAASYYGTPRTTMDADVVIRILSGEQAAEETCVRVEGSRIAG